MKGYYCITCELFIPYKHSGFSIKHLKTDKYSLSFPTHVTCMSRVGVTY